MLEKKQNETIKEYFKRCYCWDGFIEATRLIEGLTEDEIVQSEKSFKYLRKILGESFIDYKTRGNNELIQYLANNTDWNRRYIIDFTNFLSSIENQTKFSKLISNLKEKPSETLCEIKLMNMFQKSGFNIEIYPNVIIKSNIKEADFKLINSQNNEVLFVEVSTCNQSYRLQKAEAIFNKISQAIYTASNSYHISFAFLLHTNIATKLLDQYLKKIEEMVKRVSKTGSFEKIEIENHFKLGVSCDSKQVDYLEWCKKNKIEPNTMREDFIDDNQIARIEVKIKDEMKQLPKENMSLIIIQSDFIFYGSQNLKKTITDLQQILFEKTNVIALIITSNITMAFGENKIKTYQDNFFIQDNRTGFGGWYLIIWNHFCDYEVSDNTKEKINRTFTSFK